MLGFFRKKRPVDPLDEMLFDWGGGNPCSVRHLLSSMCAFGRTGSGKSSGVGRMILESVVRYGRSGGYIPVAKPEDVGNVRRIFAGAGRSNDLIEMGPGSDTRLNVLDELSRGGADTRDLVRCLMLTREVMRGADSKGGENADFFETAGQEQLYHAVVVVKLATGGVSAPDLERFVNTAARSPQQIAGEEWRAEFHNQCMKRAYEVNKSAVDRHEFGRASTYWLTRYPVLAERTRSSVDMVVAQILQGWNTGIVHELISSGTTVSPADLLGRGKWLLLNMPPAEHGDSGTCVAAAVKFATQRAGLKREFKPGDYINCIFQDEAQQFTYSFDHHYLAQCRSHGCCMVNLTQSRSSYYAALKGESGRSEADALLANFSTQVFHALGDFPTAEYAANLVGKNLQTFVGGSLAPRESLYEELVGHGKFTGSFSEHYEHVLQPAVFLTGLRTGGPRNNYQTDAIVVKTGDPFRSGQNWLRVAFDQR